MSIFENRQHENKKEKSIIQILLKMKHKTDF